LDCGRGEARSSAAAAKIFSTADEARSRAAAVKLFSNEDEATSRGATGKLFLANAVVNYRLPPILIQQVTWRDEESRCCSD
jgi:hypothetical protein